MLILCIVNVSQMIKTSKVFQSKVSRMLRPGVGDCACGNSLRRKVAKVFKSKSPKMLEAGAYDNTLKKGKVNEVLKPRTAKRVMSDWLIQDCACENSSKRQYFKVAS